MNVICNTCLGSHMYYSTKKRLVNQFSWCGIDLKDFVYLANHYDELDYNDVSFELETRLYQTRESVLCKIEGGKVKIHFSHYLQDDSFSEPGKCDRYKYCMLYKDILGFAREKWFSRMGRTDERPTFIYCFNLWDMRHPKTRKEYGVALDWLFSIKEKLIILMHESVDISDREIPENITVVKLPDEELTFCSEYMVEALLKQFKD